MCRCICRKSVRVVLLGVGAQEFLTCCANDAKWVLKSNTHYIITREIITHDDVCL